MKVTVRIKAKQGFRPSVPGYTARQDLDGWLVGNTVVLPPGPTLNGCPVGMKKAPWLAVPLLSGMFEVAMCDEDPTPALLGQTSAPPTPAKVNVKAKEA